MKGNITSTIIDMKRMSAFFGQNANSIHEFLKCFMQSADEQIKIIDNAVRIKDSHVVKSSLHRLKGSAGNSGFKKIDRLCENAEQAIIQEDWEATKNILQNIKKLLEELRLEINKKFNK